MTDSTDEGFPFVKFAVLAVAVVVAAVILGSLISALWATVKFALMVVGGVTVVSWLVKLAHD
jgi:hypothetical protein